MAIKKKTKNRILTNKKRSVTLNFNQAITSLSLLGTLWRTAIAIALFLSLYLIGELINLANLQKLTGDSSLVISTFGDSYVLQTTLLALLGFSVAVFLIDLFYVVLTKRYPLNDKYDKAILFGLELFFVSVMLLDWAVLQAALINNTTYPNYTTDVVMVIYFVVLIFALPARAFIGVTRDVAMKRK